VTTYAIVPATPAHVEAMIPNARQADIDEVRASSGLEFGAALRKSFVWSTSCWAGLVDEGDGPQVACIFGVAPINLLARKGSPWMLGTPLIERHALPFLRRNRWGISTMLAMYNHLENYVDVRNTAAIAWLRWLGFRFDDPAPHGVEGRAFMRFEMRVSNV
jgi:hypothetical protein